MTIEIAAATLLPVTKEAHNTPTLLPTPTPSFSTPPQELKTEEPKSATTTSSLEKLEKHLQNSVYTYFTLHNIDWCRYCGTTEGICWRTGPWGKKTLCNKHGCDYRNHGSPTKIPRLDLSPFNYESIEDRKLPVLQEYCWSCQSHEKDKELIMCSGCPRAFHVDSLCIENLPQITSSTWYCTPYCEITIKSKKILCDLSRVVKDNLPFMRKRSPGIRSPPKPRKTASSSSSETLIHYNKIHPFPANKIEVPSFIVYSTVPSQKISIFENLDDQYYETMHLPYEEAEKVKIGYVADVLSSDRRKSPRLLQKPFEDEVE